MVKAMWKDFLSIHTNRNKGERQECVRNVQ